MPLDIPFDSVRLARVRGGAVALDMEAAVFRVDGPGALTCLQGLLTNDLDGPGEGSLVYGALLTPKGMIAADLLVFRLAGGFTLLADRTLREVLWSLLVRSLPPRLATVTDLSDSWRSFWYLGAVARTAAGVTLGGVPPEPGRAAVYGELLAGAGTPAMPFVLVGVGPAAAVSRLAAGTTDAGFQRGSAVDLAAARVLAGWPTLGSDTDEKSLPQEVRFDAIGGVSYTKGCYTGQETVARVHFRGHVNRTLRGVMLEGGGAPADRTLTLDLRNIGTIRSALLLEDRVLALAMLRREVADGAEVLAGKRRGTVIALPIAEEWLR